MSVASLSHKPGCYDHDIVMAMVSLTWLMVIREENKRVKKPIEDISTRRTNNYPKKTKENTEMKLMQEKNRK